MFAPVFMTIHVIAKMELSLLIGATALTILCSSNSYYLNKHEKGLFESYELQETSQFFKFCQLKKSLDHLSFPQRKYFILRTFHENDNIINFSIEEIPKRLIPSVTAFNIVIYSK